MKSYLIIPLCLAVAFISGCGTKEAKAPSSKSEGRGAGLSSSVRANGAGEGTSRPWRTKPLPVAAANADSRREIKRGSPGRETIFPREAHSMGQLESTDDFAFKFASVKPEETRSKILEMMGDPVYWDDHRKFSAVQRDSANYHAESAFASLFEANPGSAADVWEVLPGPVKQATLPQIIHKLTQSPGDDIRKFLESMERDHAEEIRWTIAEHWIKSEGPEAAEQKFREVYPDIPPDSRIAEIESTVGRLGLVK